MNTYWAMHIWQEQMEEDMDDVHPPEFEDTMMGWKSGN